MSGGLKKRIGILFMMAGLCLMAYPCFSFLLNDISVDRRMSAFEEHALDVKPEEVDELQHLSKRYQEAIDGSGGSIVDPWAVNDYHEAVLDEYAGDKVFGYLSIPKLDIYEALYLGAGEEHLTQGVAQLEGSALPLGGKGTRCVIAGHRGGYRNSPKFLYVDRLSEGDLIYLYVQNRRLIYQVREQEIILPSENEKLAPLAEKDMLTLLTCHPFPLNSQRLLINAERVNEGEDHIYLGAIVADGHDVEKDPLTQRSRYAGYLFLSVLVLAILYLSVKLIRPNFTLRWKKSNQ